jgi:hypothetical protein
MRWAAGAAAAYASLAASCDAYIFVGQLLATHTLVLALTGAGRLHTLHPAYSTLYSLGAPHSIDPVPPGHQRCDASRASACIAPTSLARAVCSISPMQLRCISLPS